jgi:CRISPR-associated protein Cas2
MFIILYYDVKATRCQRMLKTCRKYLVWVQNSVFEGELTEAAFERLIMELNQIIDKKENDSIVVYKFRTKKYTERRVYGKDKKEAFDFI